MKYKPTIGNAIPEPVEISESCVYLRRNIKHVREAHDDDGTIRNIYGYEEACISKDEYIAILTSNQKDIEDAIIELASIIGGE